MKNRNLKFLLLGMTIFSLSAQSFSQEYREGNSVVENASISTKDQIANLEKRNVELSKERQDQLKLLKRRQNVAQGYRHRLTYETGAKKEEIQKKQDAILAEIKDIHAKRSEISTLIHNNEALIENLKNPPIQPVVKPVEEPVIVDKVVEKPPVIDKVVEEIQPAPIQPVIKPAEEPVVIDKAIEVVEGVLPVPNEDIGFNYEKEIQEDNLIEKEEQKVLIKNSILDLAESLESSNSLDKLTEPASLEEAIKVLKSLKNNTPYTHSLKTGIESIQLFENSVILKDKTAQGQWNAKGTALSSHSKNDAKISSNINGAIGTVEYGLSENSSLGFSLGGNHQKSSFKGDSSLKGTSMYLGGYYEYNVKNLRTVTGLGYQLTDLKSERDKNTEKYKQNTYNVFTEVSYMTNFSETFHIEPTVRLSYYNLSQDKIKENYTANTVNMSVNKTTKKIGNLFVGSNFIKDSYFNSGKLSSIFTVGINKTLGDRNLNATGNIIGKDKIGSDFKLDNEKFSNLNGVTGLTLEFQDHNNITYSTGANFLFGDNSNKALQFSVGVGYKF